jgi:type IV pilus assembly protein PilM
MGIFGFFEKAVPPLALDIGASSCKVLELDTSVTPHRLLRCHRFSLPADISSPQGISDPQKAGKCIADYFDAQGITAQDVSVAIPSPHVFTKRVKVPLMGYSDLESHISYEAVNLIPQHQKGVKIDFHVLGSAGKGQLEVLLVGAKNDVVDSILAAVEWAGLDVNVLDVDVFALSNIFEVVHPEAKNRTTALVNIGSRYSAVTIVSHNKVVFAGDLPMGGKTVTDAAAQSANVSGGVAEQQKVHGSSSGGASGELLQEALFLAAESFAGELSRRLNMFWNAAEIEDAIDSIYLSGGGARTPGLLQSLEGKTGLSAEILDPLSAFTKADGVEVEGDPCGYSIAAGLALRVSGDKATDLGEYS